MKYKNIARKIIDLKNDDLALRDKMVQNGKLGEGYHPEMQALHERNAAILDAIITDMGYPTIQQVGSEASEAAWLIIQHAIGQPEFMKKCAALLADAVDQNLANPLNLAYLHDRIAVWEGQKQLYGTQFDWDKNGELSPHDYDNIIKVNERRRSVGLNTLEDQTQIIRQQAGREGQYPPKDFEKRKSEIDAWRKSVGWKK